MTTRRTAAASIRGMGRRPGRGWRVAAALGVAGAVLAGCGPADHASTTTQAATTAVASPTPLPSATPGPSPAPHPSGAPSAPPTAPPMAASVPVRVVVPAIGVDSELMDLGLNADGTMQVPPGAFPAGWYTGAPTPGELGPAVLAGHVDWGGRHGVFHDLAALRAGDAVVVTRADGSVVTFRVTDVQEYPKDEFPTAAVYGDTDGPELRLITCGGDFDHTTKHYVDNVVAYATMVPTPTAP